MAQSLPNFVRTCTNMWGTIPDLILGILWNGVKWRRMTSQDKITWNYWKAADFNKKNHVTLCSNKEIHKVHYNSQWRSEVWLRGEGGGGVKPFINRQWQLRYMALVKSVNTTASIRTTHLCSFHSFIFMSSLLLIDRHYITNIIWYCR